MSYYSQPVSLTVTAGLATSGETATSVVEVATDADFGAIVMTKSVAASPGASATVTLDRLGASATYYWRVKTTTARTPPIVSATSTFSVGPRLVIGAPRSLSPEARSWTARRPNFTVTNAERTGPPATLVYELEISRDVDFAAPVTMGTASEGVERTSFLLPTDLAGGVKYFWRVRATDTAKGEAGDYSPPQEFTVWGLHTGPYRLAVNLPSPLDRQVTLDADLVENQGTFTLARDDRGTGGSLSMQLDVSPAGTVGGHISSNYVVFSPSFSPAPNRLSISSTPGYYTILDGPRATPVQLSGNLSSDVNSVRGTFEAYISIDNSPYGWVGDRAFSSPPIRRFFWLVMPR